MGSRIRRRAVGAAIALAVSTCLPIAPLTASAAMKSPPIAPGIYGRLAPGSAVRLPDLRLQPSIARPLRSTPLIVKNPAAYAAAKAASGRATAVKPPRGTRTTAPLVSQGTVEEQLTVFPGMDLVQGFNALGPDQSKEPPDTQLAVGPSAVVETVNSNMSVWSKSGTRLQVVDLNLFYTVPAGFSITDARILYDRQSSRFIQSAVAIDSAADSILLVAVSKNSDPTSSWTKWQVKRTTQVLIDQPKVGTSDDKVTLSWAEAVPPPCQNQPDFFCFNGQLVTVLQKSDLLASAAPRTYATAGDFSRFGIVPAQALSSTSTQFLVYNNADPYYLVENACLQPPPGYYGTCPTLGEMSLSGTPSAHNIAITEVDPQILPTTAPVNAAQSGSTTLINTGDDRLLSAVWRDGSLWTAATDGNCSETNPQGPGVTESCVRVIEAKTNQGGMIFHDAGLNLGSDYTYYPAVSTDEAGDVFVVFSRSTPTMYPGVWISGLLAGDVAPWSPMTLLKPGAGPYDSTAGTCAGHNRWGDYSGAATDPTDPTDVWVAGEYALDNPSTCVWGTAIGRLTYSAPTVTSVTPGGGSPSTGGTSVTITGTDFVSGATTVYFGTTPAPSGTTTVLSPNSLTTTAPPGSGWVNVSASTADGHGPPGAFFKYPRVEAAPGSLGSLPGGTARTGAPPPVPTKTAGPRPAIPVRLFRLFFS